MDAHSAGAVAVLGTVGAATGAISAVLFYAMCMKRKGFTIFSPGRGPLNWFEKDLLDRAKEAAKSTTEDFIELGNVAGLTCNPTISRELSDNICEEVEWQRKDPPYDASILDSREVIQRLSSEGDDEPKTPVSPFAPPLPGGAVVASDERMVIVKPQPRTSTGSRLNSADSDCAFQKQSSWSSAGSFDEPAGELQLSLTYDSANGVLTVKLLEAHDLRARELSGSADPYAKIRLLPDRSNTSQTKVHKRTLNPVFNEEFKFETTSLTGATLEILLYDFDAASKHRGLGYVRLPLPPNSTDCLDGKPVTLMRPIHRYGAEGSVYRSDPLGELMVSLFYDASSAKLTVIVVRAINLNITDDSATQNSETYVMITRKISEIGRFLRTPFLSSGKRATQKVTLSKDGKSLKKKKTAVCKDAHSPVWNDVLTFDLGSDILATCILEFSVVRTNGEILAKCEVSKKCQKELFHRALAGKGASVQWVPLTRSTKRERLLS